MRTLQGPPPNHVKFEESTNRYIISSQAFSPSKSDGKVSGDLGQLLEADGLTPTALYPAVERALGAAALPIGEVRGAGCDAEHSPMDHNWYHGGITGVGNKTRIKRALRAASFEIIEVDQEEARRQHEEKRAQVNRIQNGEAE